MESRELPSPSHRKIPEIRVKLHPPKKLIKKSSKPSDPKTRLSSLKAKIYFAEMQKLRKSPKINKISREIVHSARCANLPRSKYIKKLLSNRQIKQSISSQSAISYTSGTSSPKFAILSDTSYARLSPRDTIPIDTKSGDIFSRSIALIKKKEYALEIQRKEKSAISLRECTFSPHLSIRESTQERSRSKSAKSKSQNSSFSKR